MPIDRWVLRALLLVAASLPLPARADGLGAEVALHALALTGVPYRFGSDDPARGLDCSGLVRHVFRAVAALELPRRAEELGRLGQWVAPAELKAGDLLFFNTRGRPFSHVGIYLGDGRFVHAPTRRGAVRIEDLAERYWQRRFNGARRLLPAPQPSDAEPGATADLSSGP